MAASAWPLEWPSVFFIQQTPLYITSTCKGLKSFMRERARRQEGGESQVLPPQIFNGSEYRGVSEIFSGHFKQIFQDYDAFDLANEDDVLEEFLGLEKRCAKVVLSLSLLTLFSFSRLLISRQEHRQGG